MKNVWIESLTKPRVVLVLFGTFLGIYGLLNFTYLPFSIPSLQAVADGKTILNVLPHYNAEVAYDYIASYGPDAVRIYYAILLIDVLLLIPTYAAFLTIGLRHAGSRVLARRRIVLNVLMALPVIAGVLNVVEDGIIVYLIESYPVRYDVLAGVCGFITSSKSLLIITSLAAVAALYLTIGVSRVAYSVGLRKCSV